MPDVRAKMRCDAVEPHGTGANVVLRAVYGDGEDNKSWSKWTPWGEVKLGITNPDAIDKFEVGKHYFVDFSKID